MSVSRLLRLGGNDGARPERDAVDVAGALRERIYASLTGVATLMLLILHADGESAWSAAISLTVAMVTLWLASLVSEVIAHAATRADDDPARDRTTGSRIRYTAGQSLELLVVPVVVLLLSLTGIWSLRTALIVAIVVMMATLAGASVYAVRRSTFSPLARVTIVLVELALGGLVIVAKVLAH